MKTTEQYKDYYLKKLIRDYGELTSRDRNSAKDFCYNEEWKLSEQQTRLMRKQLRAVTPEEEKIIDEKMTDKGNAIDGLNEALIEYEKRFDDGYELFLDSAKNRNKNSINQIFSADDIDITNQNDGIRNVHRMIGKPEKKMTKEDVKNIIVKMYSDADPYLRRNENGEYYTIYGCPVEITYLRDDKDGTIGIRIAGEDFWISDESSSDDIKKFIERTIDYKNNRDVYLDSLDKTKILDYLDSKQVDSNFLKYVDLYYKKWQNADESLAEKRYQDLKYNLSPSTKFYHPTDMESDYSEMLALERLFAEEAKGIPDNLKASLMRTSMIKSSKAEELEMFNEESKYGNRSEFEDFKRNHPESAITYLDWRKYLNGYEDNVAYEYEDENGNMYTWDMIKKDIDDWVNSGRFEEENGDLPEYFEKDGTPKYEKIYDDFWDIGSNGVMEYIGSSLEPEWTVYEPHFKNLKPRHEDDPKNGWGMMSDEKDSLIEENGGKVTVEYGHGGSCTLYGAKTGDVISTFTTIKEMQDFKKNHNLTIVKNSRRNNMIKSSYRKGEIAKVTNKIVSSIAKDEYFNMVKKHKSTNASTPEFRKQELDAITAFPVGTKFAFKEDNSWHDVNTVYEKVDNNVWKVTQVINGEVNDEYTKSDDDVRIYISDEFGGNAYPTSYVSGYGSINSSRRNNMKKIIKSVYTLGRNEIDKFEQTSPDLGVKFDEPLLVVHDYGYIYNHEGFEKYINEITQLYPDNWEDANEAYHTDSIEEFIDMCESDWFRHDFGAAFDFYREGLKQMAESTISEVPADGQPFSIKNGFAFKLLGENETDFDVENPYWVDDYSLQRIDGFFCQINPSIGNQFDVVIDPDYFNVPEGESVVTSSRKPIKSSKWVEDVADKKGITFEQVLEVFKDNGYGEDEADDFWNSKWNDVTDAFGEDGIAGLDELFGIEITSSCKPINSSPNFFYDEDRIPNEMKKEFYKRIYYYNEDDAIVSHDHTYESSKGMTFAYAKRLAKKLALENDCDSATIEDYDGDGVNFKFGGVKNNMKIQSKRLIKSGTSNFGSNDDVFGYSFPLVAYIAENYYYDEETDSETEERDYDADQWEYEDALSDAKALADEMNIPQYDDYSEPYLCGEPFMIEVEDGYYEGMYIKIREGTNEEDIYNTNEYGSYYDGGRPFTDEEMNKFADKINDFLNKLCSEYGWMKLGVSARFSNGETWYNKIDNSRKPVTSGLTFRQAVQDFKAAGQWNDYYEMQQDWEAYKDGLERDGVISEKTRSTWGNPCTPEGFKKWNK